MNLLFVSHKHPWPLHDGTRHRLYHILQALTSRHAVTCVTVVPPGQRHLSVDGFPLADACARLVTVEAEPTSTIRNAGSPWRRRWDRLANLALSPLPDVIGNWQMPELLPVLRDLNASESFDLAWVERSYVAESVRAAGFDRMIVDVDDVETISHYRALRHSRLRPAALLGYAELLKLYAYERRLPRRFGRLVVCKEADRQFFGRDADRVTVIPNGVAAFPYSEPSSERPGEMLFLGTMGYPPNIDAVQYFHHDILPHVRAQRSEAAFHVIGKNAEPDVLALHDGQTCVIHGLVPDVTPYFDSAAIVVAPIRLGSGTRLKVLESLARGKAVVATTMAAEGLDLRPGVDLEIADSADAFAAGCARLLDDPDRRRRLGESGRQRVLEAYNWDGIEDRVLDLVEQSAPSTAVPTEPVGS